MCSSYEITDEKGVQQILFFTLIVSKLKAIR